MPHRDVPEPASHTCATSAAIVLLTALAALALWGCASSKETPERFAMPEPETTIVGENLQHGNIIAVQPYMLAEDYASTWHFHVKIASYLKTAHDRGWIWKKTVVVFPASIGTWLVAVDEAPEIYQLGSEEELFSALAGRYRLDVLGLMPFLSSADRTRHAIFALKADAMVKAYQNVFSRLARDYSVFIVAGSIVLPEPAVEEGLISVTEGGRLYNAAFVFGPDGRAIGAPVLEAHPTPIEQTYISAGNCFTAPSFEIPSGRLGVLVGDDALFPQCYEVLREQRAEFLVAAMSLPHRGAWSETWSGYKGYTSPSEFAVDDFGKITVHQAYLKYSLPGLLVFSGAKIGVTTFIRGRLWGTQPDGQIVLVQEGDLTEGPYVDGPTLLNLWLSGALPDAPLVAPEDESNNNGKKPKKK